MSDDEVNEILGAIAAAEAKAATAEAAAAAAAASDSFTACQQHCGLFYCSAECADVAWRSHHRHLCEANGAAAAALQAM